MIHLSVNVNKIATLRNSRGGNIPNLIDLSRKIMDYGAHGITIHPREDERHIRTSDILPLREMIIDYNNANQTSVEFNMEGEPSPRFLELVLLAKPDQATLVPVTPGEITSDHGFVFEKDKKALEPIISSLKKENIRISLFVDAGVQDLQIAKDMGADRIELYTGPYADAFDKNPGDPKLAKAMLSRFEFTAKSAQSLGLEINAGHDLDHENLTLFRNLPGLIEVSIGHRLMSTALEWGLEKTIKEYLRVLNFDS
ncbi:MAG: pyridoxine 5'-phosphate synthase [Leptospira sp.]|nr:pyridoxine 5'-phosphate synthase [Leptospira sp.]